MHTIDDYVFDAERLIFYKKDIPSCDQQIIQEAIPSSDHYLDLISGLDKLDACRCTAQNRPIDLIGLCLTYNCHLRCNYCSYSSGDKCIDCLATIDVMALVVRAIKMRIIYNMASKVKKSEPLRFFFTGGGEPTYNWKLFKETVEAIMVKCREYNIPYYLELTTNGMVNSKQRDFIKAYFNKVMVSYDGCPELQNRNRPCAHEQKLTCGIVEETIKDFINSSLKVTIRSTVWHYDFVRLKEMCNYICSNFVHFDEWSIMPIVPSGRALNGNDINRRYNIDEYNFFSYYIDLINHAKEMNYSIYISTPVFNNTVSQYCCGATFVDCFWLMPDKKIINCIEAERFKVEIGRIENGCVNIYNQYDDHMLEIVKSSFRECKNCISYRFCKGGCPLKTIRDRHFGTTYKQYECSMIRQYWRYVFKNVLQGNECFGWAAKPVKDHRLDSYNILKLIKTEEKKNEN